MILLSEYDFTSLKMIKHLLLALFPDWIWVENINTSKILLTWLICWIKSVVHDVLYIKVWLILLGLKMLSLTYNLNSFVCGAESFYSIFQKKENCHHTFCFKLILFSWFFLFLFIFFIFWEEKIHLLFCFLMPTSMSNRNTCDYSCCSWHN